MKLAPKGELQRTTKVVHSHTITHAARLHTLDKNGNQTPLVEQNPKRC